MEVLQQHLVRSDPHVFKTYTVWALFDVMMVAGTCVLGACYAWARALGHVGVFCDISDLVVHLPERIVFRLNFSLIGALLTALALPIHDVVASRLRAGQSTCTPKAAAVFQVVAGVGVILVGACGPEEIEAVHLTAAFMGFGGAAISQILLNGVLYHEEQPTKQARTLHGVRCVISFLFLTSAVLLGLGEASILPEPCEHIFEWCLWFLLLAWYFTFKWDFSTFCLASAEMAGAAGSTRTKFGRLDGHVVPLATA